MLRGISPVISPELLKILAEMGHGDELVIADANYPAAATARRLVRADGVAATDLLDAVLDLIPLDSYAEHSVMLMSTVGDDPAPEVWKDYREAIERHGEPADAIEWIDRFGFYDRGSEAYAVVATGETTPYANIILKKGVVA